MTCRFLEGLFLLITYVAVVHGERHIFVAAPNLMRAGNTETVLISVYNTAPVEVTISLKNIDQSFIAPPQKVQVNQDEPMIMQVYVNPANLPHDDEYGTKLYAKLIVTCPSLSNFDEEKDILIGFEKGVVFVQTDKPIYTPDQKVEIRILVLDQDMLPSEQQIQLDIITPQGVVVDRKRNLVAEDGFISKNFALPHEPLFGNWSVAAFYGAGMKTNRTVQFEVKEYVLPTFSVKISTPDYILRDQESLHIEVTARYVYGKPVRGLYYLKLGVLEPSGDINIMHKHGDLLTDGMAFTDVPTGALGPDWFAQNVGKRLYTEVSVLEEASGIHENASDTSTKFVSSPYIIDVDRRTNKYFKTDLDFSVKVDLYWANMKPAHGVRMRITATGDEGAEIAQPINSETRDGRVDFSFNAGSHSIIHIKLETKNESLSIDNNAVYDFDMIRAVHPGGDFLMLQPPGEKGRAGNDMSVKVFPVDYQDTADTGLTYFVINGGSIMMSNTMENSNTQFVIPVNYDLMPTARVVGFYINDGGYVVTDSQWIEMERRCENTITLTKDPASQEVPDAEVYLHIAAKPSTKVAILGVDKAVYLLQDYHKLTSDKMFDRMSTYDTGCGPGGGQNTGNTFENAGLIVITSAELEVVRRQEYECDDALHRRSRRSIDDELEEELMLYEGDEERLFACRRGHSRRFASLTCEERREQFKDVARTRFPDPNNRIRRLAGIFIQCCETATALHESDDANRGRSNSNGNVDSSRIGDFSKVNIRSDFKETWIFEIIDLGDSESVRQKFTSPSSITEWEISAIGLSTEYPMCIGEEPLTLTIRKDFFVQLHLPYSVVRKEQVEIVATVFNYYKQPLEVEVYLRTTEAVCSQGVPNEFSAMKSITVPGEDAASVKYVVIGLTAGSHAIEVAARSSSVGANDVVRKELRIVPEGIETFFDYTAPLDPTGSMEGEILVRTSPALRPISAVQRDIFPNEFRQVNTFNFSLPSSAVPNTERCEVSVIGSILGPIVSSVTNVDSDLGSLIKAPTGCGEQTMSYLSPNVYILHYLTNVGAVEPNQEIIARDHILSGIAREQTYRKPDGSFAAFTYRTSSSWLTAFVSKVFCHASKIENVHVDDSQICASMKWLIDNAQRPDGSFRETYTIIHLNMAGGVQGDAAFTAFILISLHECECIPLISQVFDAVTKAQQFLETQLDGITRSYNLAIVTYALALVGSPLKNAANDKLKDQAIFVHDSNYRLWGAEQSDDINMARPYWFRTPPSAHSVETTGYALLAQLTLEEFSYSHPIARWLSDQQSYKGGYASTQDTTVALQALSEYAILTGVDEELDMNCTLVHDHDDRPLEFKRITRENQLLQQTAEIRPVNIPFTVTTKGQGKGKLNVRVTYNSISTDIHETGCAFELSITAIQEQPRRPNPLSRVGNAMPDNEPHLIKLEMTVETRSLTSNETSMSIIDVGIPSGFTPDAEDLELIVNTSALISRHEASERSVIFYADHIPTNEEEPLRFSFRVDQTFSVGNLQPVPVKVYDYYSPSEQCTKFYHPAFEDETASRLSSICEGDVCVCAAGDCLNCTKETTVDELLTRSCASGVTYAYQIFVNAKQPDVVGFEVFNATVVEVLKEAGEDIGLDDFREFWISTSCLDSCKSSLREGDWFLVIGTTALKYETKDGDFGYKYILDQSATLLPWRQRQPNKVQHRLLYDLINGQDGFAARMREGARGCA